MTLNINVLDAAALADGYKPFMVEGNPTGQLSEVAGNDNVRAGVFRLLAGEYPDNTPLGYLFETDEYVWVIEGSVEVTDPDGETVTLRAGDAAFFRAGSESVWCFHAPFRKFSVEVEGESK